MSGTSTAEPRWPVALLLMAAVALFLLLHPYAGLTHDARLYTLQALSHLRPDLYGQDVFVLFGSQDDYTLFSPLYAWAISVFGLEPAAALLTFVGACLFLAATWTLAHALLPKRQAAMTIVLLLLVPAHYGPQRIFYFIEGFITPRLFAEALTLFSLAGWLTGRRIIALALSGCALLVHPIIGSAGLALIVSLEWLIPNWRRLLPWLLPAALVAAIALAGWLPISSWQFDQEWYEIAMRRTYLTLLHWDADDWGRVTTVLCTLTLASLLPLAQLRTVAIAALIATSGLLLVALVGGDLLRITIVVQAQPWRVLWLGTVIAILLMPPLYVEGWRGGVLFRCALLLLAAAWVTPSATSALIAALLAAACAASTARSIPPSSARLLMAGAWGALALTTTHNLGTSLLSWDDGLVQSTSLPPLFDEVQAISRSGVAPALILAAGIFLAWRHPSKNTVVTLGTLCVLAVASLSIPAFQTWSTARYSDSLREAFAEWRTHIPPGSNVMWTGEDTLWGDGATNTWFLLERPSFVSGAQAPNALFSRKAAIEMRARSQALWGLLPFADPFRPKGEHLSRPPQQLLLAPVCQASAVRYIVTRETMTDAIPIPAPQTAPPFLRDYKLYICT